MAGLASPDVPAFYCYLIVVVAGFFVARAHVNERLKDYPDHWAFLSAWLLFLAYWAMPPLLFWLLDYTSAVQDTSLFAAFVVAFGYRQLFAGGIQGVSMPGQTSVGYGMIAYAANPGMLTGVRRGRVDLDRIALPGGGTYAGGVVVSAENAHPGHVVHDLLHALGGAKDGKRPVPDLYDYELQSNPPKGERMRPELFSIHTGPWDIMSHHFIRMDDTPPPPPSSFIRRQLGWIDDAQVVTVRPGETREVTLAPLESGGSPLVVRIPLAPARYLLVENRQPTGLGAVLPSSGMLVLEVNEDREEGTDIVRAIDANPGVPKLARAPFQPGSGERHAHVSAADGVAVVPLAIERSGRLRLVVATPDRAPTAGPGGPRR